MNDVVNDLKNFTGWNDITERDGLYLITFYISDVKQISGLSQNESTYYLNTDNFDGEDICFCVKTLDPTLTSIEGEMIVSKELTSTTWYYTRNKKLHRDGKPARITFSPECCLNREYFQHGELHNEDGPAVDAIEFPRISEYKPNVHRISWKERTQQFYYRGSQKHLKFPFVTKRFFLEGHQYFLGNVGIPANPEAMENMHVKISENIFASSISCYFEGTDRFSTISFINYYIDNKGKIDVRSIQITNKDLIVSVLGKEDIIELFDVFGAKIFPTDSDEVIFYAEYEKKLDKKND